MQTFNPSTMLLALSVVGWAATTETSPAQTEVTLVPFTQTWKYNAWGTNLSAAWVTTNYTDAWWQSGQPVFGQEESFVLPRSILTFVPSPSVGGPLTAYFRTHFNFAAGSPAGVVLVASNLLDDGAVFYLNGLEIQRTRIPGGAVNYSTLAQNQPNEGVYEVFSFPATNLQRGDNVLAVELHQNSSMSSDDVFGMSLTATLLDPVAITDQPQSQTVHELEAVTFTVGWSGHPPPTFQWFTNDMPIPDATNASYFIPAVPRSFNGLGFWVVAQNVVSNMTYTATSAVAVLTVVLPPSINVQPVSQTVTSGSLVALSVAASGTEPLSYQWQNQARIIPGATNATYALNPALTNHAGNYAVVVTNPYGAVTSFVASVVVFIPAAISTPPLTQVVAAGGTAIFHVGATGYPPPNYQWWFQGEALAGATGSSVVLTNVGTNALGTYQVVVWNAYSSATSSPALLLLLPSLRSPFMGATVTWGKAATLSVAAWGSGPLSYQWFKDEAPVPGATNETLAFAAVQISDGGLYSVVVSSPWGSVTNAPAQLVVNPANIALGLYAGVIIDGVPGYTYGIQYTTDLRDTNSWVTATNLTLSDPVELWVDQSVNIHATGNAKRYYRVTGQ